MTGGARFAKGRLGDSPAQDPLRCFDMHALDHLVAETLGSAFVGLDKLPCPVQFRSARREGAVSGLDLVRMDQALSIET
jgi:hypothetical protein